ncbi:glycoside hydrolase family 5 protein [Calocera viscosa TUFC12733]|uniref:Glycoside hydrolase family 5 protein n=1 Tax=Calocera viscosa (strain TUFC12733) TaxID=1330018 RepID=A0A167M0Z0_CALVF|nr:glycoside hydrolase family 5 protein [Calocera viscosa TUFC12733]
MAAPRDYHSVPITAVDVSTNQIVDAHGRQRFFRGLNVVYKVAPFIPLIDRFDPHLSFNIDDLRVWNSLNLNVVRLNIPWAGVEPERDKYDEEYILKVRELVRLCAKEGVWVVLDAHQDIYSERFCGNGMPDWSITRDEGYFGTWAFPRPIKPWPAQYSPDSKFPLIGTPAIKEYDLTGENWGPFYASDACTRAFWGLYTNQQGIRDHFVESWRRVAVAMKDEPNLLGYTIMNEPAVSARTFFRWPYNFFLSKISTERGHLLDLYDAVTNAIRSADPTHLIFFEPACGNSGGHFPRVPGCVPVKGESKEERAKKEEAAKAKSVLSWHYYPTPLEPDTWVAVFKRRDGQVRRLGCGAMLTEFDTGFDGGKKHDHVLGTFEACDRHLISWIGWQYKKYFHVSGCPTDGSLVDHEAPTAVVRPLYAKLFSRTYASAVAGELKYLHHDYATSSFSMHYVPKGTGDDAITEIKFSTEWHYPHGFEVKLEGEGTRWEKLDEQTIGVWAKEGQEVVKVSIDAKPALDVQEAEATTEVR